MSDNKRIIKNTGFLYIRMFLIMIVTLYMSRVVLDKFGATDYGLYNVVGGVVGFLGFLNGTLSTSSMRFLTYELGAGNFHRLKTTFNTTFYIHLFLSIVVFLLLNTVGLWFFYNKLVIPDNRLDVCFWVYQISILTTMVSITQVPYTSVIMAHEKMDLYAYVSVFEALAKLVVTYLISVTPFDRMLTYAILLAVIQISVALFYRIYGSRKFSECHLALLFDKSLFKRIMGFSGWNLTAHVSEILRHQGIVILMNLFFQPFVVAAQAIANQVSSAMMLFVNNVRTAVNPQVIKLYAAEDYDGSKRLTLKSSLYIFDLLMVLGLPLILLMEPILHLWLKEVPPYTVLFAQYIVAGQILGNYGASLYIPMVAAGKVKKNSIASVIVGFGGFGLLYLILRIGGDVMWVQYMNIFTIVIFSAFIKPYILYKDVDYKIKEMAENYIECIMVAVVSVAIASPVRILLDDTLLNDIIILFTSIGSVIFASLLFMDKDDRKKGFAFVKNRIIHRKS